MAGWLAGLRLFFLYLLAYMLQQRLICCQDLAKPRLVWVGYLAGGFACFELIQCFFVPLFGTRISLISFAAPDNMCVNSSVHTGGFSAKMRIVRGLRLIVVGGRGREVDRGRTPDMLRARRNKWFINIQCQQQGRN